MSSSPCLLALLQSTSVTTGVMRVLQKESCVYHGDIVETVYICQAAFQQVQVIENPTRLMKGMYLVMILKSQ